MQHDKSTTVMNETCAICKKKAGILKCQGCQVIFCRDDSNAHRTELDQQLEEFMNKLNTFQQMSSEASVDLKASLICHIDTWETKSIQKIKEAAEEARQQVETTIVSSDEENAACIHEIAEQLRQNRQDDDFDERNLKRWKERLDELNTIVSKPYISIDEQQTGSPFIMKIRIGERDIFNRTCGDVCIEEGQLARHNVKLFGNHGEIRGKREYNIGIHRILFKIEHLDNFPWFFFGIISKLTPMQTTSHTSSSAYGWAGNNEVFMNGQCLKKNINEYISDYLKGDIIELILDCDHRLIRMNNFRSTKSYEMIVDLTHCPFPWMVHLNLFHIQTRIRINP